MLREAVLLLAAQQGRTEALNRACADALARLPGVWRVRIGTHRRAAGQLAEALDDLVEGAWQRTFRGDLLGATHLAEELEELLPPDDPRRGKVLRTRVRAARLRGEHEETLLRLRRLLHWARGRDDPHQLAMALQQRAVVRVQAGAPQMAVQDAEEAVQAAQSVDDRGFCAQALAWLGLVHARARSYDEAADAFDAADALGSEYLSTYGRGVVLLDLGHPADAAPLLDQASALAREHADPMNAAQFDAVLAQALRLSGEAERASSVARAALDQLAGWQVQWAGEARVSLALSELACGRAHQAEGLLRQELAHGDHEEARDTARAVLLALHLRRGEPGPEVGGELLSRAYELEVRDLLIQAAEAAEAGGHAELAAQAREAAARLGP
jgi:tetratricopeptide (TPR) repeat protein